VVYPFGKNLQLYAYPTRILVHRHIILGEFRDVFFFAPPLLQKIGQRVHYLPAGTGTSSLSFFRRAFHNRYPLLRSAENDDAKCVDAIRYAIISLALRDAIYATGLSESDIF
jgi:hypothetical protein